jgi:spoIIIJ-associated protein
LRSEPVLEAGLTEKEKLAREYLKDILTACGLTADYKVSREENGAYIDIEGEGLGLIIGRRGETLDALQYLAGLVANRGEGDYLRLTVDCGEYRVKRRDTLEALAKRLAQQVLKTNTSKTLEPMNPFERRIIHATVSEIEGVSSSSVGEEPGRRVVITTPTARPGRPGREGDDKFRSRPPRREGAERPPRRESTARTERPERPERGDRRDDRRGGGRGRDSRPPRRQSTPVPQGPPKQTPEAEAMSSIKFGKIDLE